VTKAVNDNLIYKTTAPTAKVKSLKGDTAFVAQEHDYLALIPRRGSTDPLVCVWAQLLKRVRR
jgi:hypothetical protein